MPTEVQQFSGREIIFNDNSLQVVKAAASRDEI